MQEEDPQPVLKRPSQTKNKDLLTSLTLNFPQICQDILYKPNHQSLPLLILPNLNILAYTNTPYYKQAVEPFLITFMEPVNRPRYIHEYRITLFSLYTAMILQYTYQDIISMLKKLSKNLQIPRQLIKKVKQFMKYSGKTRLRLRDKSYQLLTIPEIAIEIGKDIERIPGQKIFIDSHHLKDPVIEIEDQQNIREDQSQQQSGSRNRLQLGVYKIVGDYFNVARFLMERNYPLLQEYAFQRDVDRPKINIDIKEGVALRFYQTRSINSIVSGGSAKSGLVILPCGAGKSLVGILVIQKIKTNSIIFCESQISVQQWRGELLKWTTISPDAIVRLTGRFKDPIILNKPCIFLTTYSMVGGSKSHLNQILRKSQQISWGVCIADEVHKLPAETFQNVLRKYKFHVKIGLTATPYREDKKIGNLYYMIGPKIIEENWLDLVNQGCLARPYCVEIRCKMTETFMKQYMQLSRPQIIHTANPTKFRVLQYLLSVHLARHDKILVFCDRPLILEHYAGLLKHAVIHGDVSSKERSTIFNLFRKTNDLNVIFLSRVGDTAIDLPCANVVIQVGIQFKSRRQQIQRLGRIMRAKPNQDDSNQHNAFFYTLASLDTRETSYSAVRQKCLIDIGFTFQIILEEDLDYNKYKQRIAKNLDQIAKLQARNQQCRQLLLSDSMDNTQRDTIDKFVQNNEALIQKNKELNKRLAEEADFYMVENQRHRFKELDEVAFLTKILVESKEGDLFLNSVPNQKSQESEQMISEVTRQFGQGYNMTYIQK